MSRVAVPLFAAAALASCGAAETSAPDAVCAAHTDGALVTFEVDTVPVESFSVWVTSPAFIDEATQLATVGGARLPCFDVVTGPGCDSRWRFSVDPGSAEFTGVTAEIFDATPSYVDAHQQTFREPDMRWCPWGATVVDVDDRR